MARDPLSVRLRPLLPALLLCIALPAAAASPAPAASEPATSDVTVAGVKVGIDRKTGRLRPLTAAESAALERAIAPGARTAGTQRAGAMAQPASAEAAVATMRPLRGGGQAMKAPASTMSQLTAHRAADGTLVVGHADDAPAAHGGQAHE